ncbi:MAG: xanthine dehydrogenase family protein molybdopterin-binding subunit [Planctomycetota bacterium]|nr:MAG: xanthine dehydrogenase family protein molybdopterin-binding subunit [Planctomycetota bacterium]
MRARSEPAWKPKKDLTVLNRDIPRVDGPEKVTGAAKYTHDIRLPRMVYARFWIHPYPRLNLTKVDVAPALKVKGVVYVKALKEAGEDVRYQGADAAIAVVAAETPEAAEDGLRAMIIEAEELYPPMVTAEQALDESSPKIGRGGKNVNVREERGDEEAANIALDTVDVLIEESYSLPVQHHVCLETHGSVVDYRGGDEATVYTSIQNVSGTNASAARALELDADKVNVITHHMGGGFGSKFGIGIEGSTACRIAKELGRPVHLMLTRGDEFLMGGNRSGSQQTIVGGASKDGRLVALVAKADRFGGTGGGAFAGLPYIYKVENSFFESRSIYTATDSSRAMRAPGHPQASFGMESMVDELAFAVGIDPLTFRKQNLEDPVYHRQLDRVAKEIGWDAHPNKTEPGAVDGTRQVGIGFAISQWGSRSRPGSQCEVRIEPDGRITSTTGTQDLGTGSRTYVAAIVAEEFGLEVGDVTARIGESAFPTSAGSGGSVTTGCSAPAIKDAAHNAREAFEARIAPMLDAEPGQLVWRGGEVISAQDPQKSLTWKQACAALGSEPLSAMGEWQEHLRSQGVHGAQAAKVEVDTVTGELKVLKMVFIQDCGLVLNRLAARSQVNGGQIQALSYGLLEARVHDPDLGLMLTDNLDDYKIAGVQEIPEMISIMDDDDDRLAVMGMAEANCIPGHGAIANALFNACGLRLRDLPLTADKIIMGLSDRS